MITEMINQMITELTATINAVNVFPILVLIAGATIFSVGYTWIVNKD